MQMWRGGSKAISWIDEVGEEGAYWTKDVDEIDM